MHTTVKQFIAQQQAEHGEYADLNLENPHLLDFQDNEIIVIDDVVYVKTSIVFNGTLNPDIAAKIELLELENFRLELEVSQLALAYEAEHVKNEALQYYVTNLNRDVEAQVTKKKNVQKANDELMDKIKVMKAELKVKSAPQKRVAITTTDDLLEDKVAKAVLLMQETEDEKDNAVLHEKIRKMTANIDSLQEQNTNLVARNRKLRHSAQFFGQVTSTIEKLNAQVQNAKASFERNGTLGEEA